MYIFRGGMITLLNSVSILLLPLIAGLRMSLKWVRGQAPVSIWTGAPILNMAINSSAERLTGAKSYSVVAHTYFITNKFDFNLQRLPLGRVFNTQYRYIAFWIICLIADRVHIYLDGGILPNAKMRSFNKLELFTYKLLAVDVFAWTYGGDCRTQRITRSLGDPNCCTDCTAQNSACICDEGLFRPRYDYARDKCVAIFSMGDMIEYTPGSVNTLYFWPLDIGDEKYRNIQTVSELNPPLVRIVHAPNHRMFKGTRFIEAAVSELSAEGLAVELVLVERVPNQQALKIYQTADIIVDQVMVGFHGFFALEAMAMSKPVVCFIREPERYIIDAKNSPIINANPENIKEVLRSWVNASRSERLNRGLQGRNFIEKHYSMDAFAKRLGKAYTELGVSK
jgi:glycosyltransferase involved in cell wall biosynthesis